MNPSVVLVRPQFAGNLGSVARAMKNFGLSDLILVQPKVLPQELEARKMAMHAGDLLERAQIYDKLSDALHSYDWVIGTSRRLGKDRQREISPRDFAAQCQGDLGLKKIAILFGTEDSGLSNEEIELCQQILFIPSDAAFPSLNLSHAVSVVAYEWFLSREEKGQSSIPGKPEDFPASFETLEAMYGDLELMLSQCGFFNSGNPRHVMRLLRNFLNRAHPTIRETQMLRGILRQLRWWKDNSLE